MPRRASSRPGARPCMSPCRCCFRAARPTTFGGTRAPAAASRSRSSTRALARRKSNGAVRRTVERRKTSMTRWLDAALDYLPQWLEYQLRHTGQPGVAIAVADRGEVVLDAAFGAADLTTGERMTPRHLFHVASHSKSFTAAGVMKLVEQRKLRLDVPVGTLVDGLHRD